MIDLTDSMSSGETISKIRVYAYFESSADDYLEWISSHCPRGMRVDDVKTSMRMILNKREVSFVLSAVDSKYLPLEDLFRWLARIDRRWRNAVLQFEVMR